MIQQSSESRELRAGKGLIDEGLGVSESAYLFAAVRSKK